MMDNNKEFQAVAGSFIFHLLLVIGLYQMPVFRHTSNIVNNPTIEVQVINQNSKNLVQTLQNPTEAKPQKEAQFLGSNTNRVPKETVSPHLGNFQNGYRPPKTKPLKEIALGEGLRVPKALPTLEYTQDIQSQFNFVLDKIQYGSVTLLNTDYSIYASFYDRIAPQIRYEWLRRVSTYLGDPVIIELLRLNKDLWSTRLEILLDKKGNFEKAVIVNSSGSQPLDLAPKDGIKAAAPFINPPKEIVSEDGKIHLHYAFAIRFDPRYFARTKKQ